MDARSDLYSLAVIGWELLVGRPPFGGETPHAVLSAHLGAPVPSAAAASAAVPPPLSRVLARAMAKDPADRYSSAEAFRRALAGAVLAPPRPVAASRDGVLSPFARRAAAVLLTVGAAGAATMGTAHLLAVGFGGGTLPPVRTAFADRPAPATIVRATATRPDTMASRIAVLPPMVASAPRPAVPVEEPVEGTAAVATADAVAVIAADAADAAAASLEVARVAVLDVADLAPKLIAALPADVRVEVLPHAEALTALAKGRVVLRAGSLAPLSRVDVEDAVRFHVSAREAEELRQAVREIRAGLGTAGSRAAEEARVKRLHLKRTSRPPVPPRAGARAAGPAPDAAAAVVAAPCNGASASGAA